MSLRARGSKGENAEQDRHVADAVVSRDDVVAAIEAKAQGRRGLSAGELVHAYRHGKLDDPGEFADVLVLSEMLPEDDALFRDRSTAAASE